MEGWFEEVGYKRVTNVSEASAYINETRERCLFRFETVSGEEEIFSMDAPTAFEVSFRMMETIIAAYWRPPEGVISEVKKMICGEE